MLILVSLVMSALHYWGNGSIRLQSPPLPMKMMKVWPFRQAFAFRLSPIRLSSGAATLSASALRSATQTGYRPELGTIHPAFALQHAVDKHRHANKPLYLCFVDPKSACDRLQWQLFWSLLQRLGVHGHMLGAVQSLYDGSLLSMRVNGQCGHSQSPFIGRREGCPLSATLFGILIDGLHHHLQTMAAAAGV